MESLCPVEVSLTPAVNQDIDFSLVLATLGERPDELSRFLRGLEKQSFRSFELIVVDQSQDDGTASLLHPFLEAFPIRHIRSSRGLSRGRNAGVAACSGGVVGFPDDDCWYHRDLLAEVGAVMTAHPEWDGVTGVTRDANGDLSLARFEPAEGDVTLRGVWCQGIEPAMFFRRELLRSLGPFDETLGVGAPTPFQAGEGTEYLARAVRAGRTVRFMPSIYVFHENPLVEFGRAADLRARSYGRGIGRVLRLGAFPPRAIVETICRPLIGAAVAGLSGRLHLARYRWNAFRGRVEGWTAPPPKEGT